MAAILEIRDGDPWWLSPDIRVVPGDDPNGPSGRPMAGRANYVWARVRNRGDVAVGSVLVRFHWSNPATGVLRSTSTLIGTSYVDLAPGETKEVLCLTPWMATIVNEGHECLVTEAVSPADPLPVPLPDAFTPAAHHQVAQRNVQVVVAMASAMMLCVQVGAPARKAKKAKLHLREAAQDEKQVAMLLKDLGLGGVPVKAVPLATARISADGTCGSKPGKKEQDGLLLDVPAGTAAVAYVHLEPTGKKVRGYQLLHVVETVDGKVAGGNSILIVNP